MAAKTMVNTTTVYPTSPEVLALREDQIHAWVDFTFIRPDPLAFGADKFDEFRRTASAGLNIDANGIFCLGSGAIGWSLNPDNMVGGDLKPFDEDSDLDLAFVSEVYFESAWRSLRRAEQTFLSRKISTRATDSGLDFQRRKFFDGAILGNNLKSLPFAPTWVKALPSLRGLSRDAVGRSIKMNFFIYRDYWSVHNSVVKSLYVCQAKGVASGDE